MNLESTEFDRIHRQQNSNRQARKSETFAHLYLQETFNLTDDDAAKQVAWTGSETGLDGWHFDIAKRNLYLLQFSYGIDPNSFKEGMRSLAQRGLDILFGSANGQRPDDFAARLRSQLTENRSLVDQVLVHFVFKGDPTEAEQSVILVSLREELESKKYLIDDFFGGRSVGLAFEFRSTDSDKIGGLVHTVSTHRYRIDFARTIAAETPSGENLQLGFVRLTDLFNMYQEMGPRFFERNVRFGLSGERPTNRALKKAFGDIVLEEKVDPEAFLFNHNGVTIAAEQFEIKKGAAYITEPRLLNGAQTVTSLARFIEEFEDDERFANNQDILDRIRVLGKVVSSAGQKFVSNVTICNNRQNPVEPWNLRANDDLQMEFQEKFRRDAGLYYERQEGAFGNISEEQLDDLGLVGSKAIEIKKLAQTFLATQGEIDKISRLRLVFENEATYTATFRESYLKANTARMILCYKGQLRLSMVIRDILAKGANKYHYINRAKNLVWALLIQALLNDEKSDELAQRFGHDLSINTEFSELLKSYGNQQVRLLLGDVIGDERYQDLMEKGQYHFLRTKATFQRCMEAGNERFGWRKRSF